ncbi:MAG: hypothetical protein HYX68_14135 [Planctomycetes bacterium]|nr:hypothetical protein [Planctomycetota bacterium]
MTRSVQQWAADAAGPVQDACNMSGLVFAFNECLADLAAHGLCNDEIDQHPICVAWTDKLDDLSRSRRLEPIPCDEPLTKLVPRFADAMRSLCKEGLDTDTRNRHPITQDFVRQVVHVTGSRSTVKLFEALDACKQMVAGQ